MGLRFCRKPGSHHRVAGWPRAGYLIHRQRAARNPAGVLTTCQRRHLASAAAQDDAYSRDRAHGHAAGLSRTAFQELYAPAHGGPWLPYRSRNDDAIRLARDPIQYTREGDALPPIAA